MRVTSTINLSIASAALRAGAESAMPAILQLIKVRANAKTPRDSGNLVDSSGYVANGLTGTVYYSSIYAPYHHEGMRADGSHVIRNRPAGGESKFLESTVNDPTIEAECMAIIADHMAGSI